MKDIFSSIENIGDKNEFSTFIKDLADDYRKNSDGWQNLSVYDYLESISAYIDDDTSINWRDADLSLMAKIFYIGKIYE